MGGAYYTKVAVLKGFSQIQPFVAKDEPENPRAPYFEFNNFVASLQTFHLLSSLERGHLAREFKKEELKAELKSIKNFDALTPLLYNADVIEGSFKNIFDSNFIMYFVQRYYYYLEKKGYCGKEGEKNQKDNKCYFEDDSNFGCHEVDLLNIPESYTNNVYNENVCEVFKQILTDQRYYKVLLKFIELLKHQIEEVTKSKKNEEERILAHAELTTYRGYVEALNASLNAVERYVKNNSKRRNNFLSEFKSETFVVVPVYGHSAKCEAISINIPESCVEKEALYRVVQ